MSSWHSRRRVTSNGGGSGRSATVLPDEFPDRQTKFPVRPFSELIRNTSQLLHKLEWTTGRSAKKCEFPVIFPAVRENAGPVIP